MAANADYQMVLGGQITATTRTPDDAQRAALDAYISVYYSSLPPGIGPIRVDVQDSDPGGDVIGVVCVLGIGGDECGAFLFRPAEGFEIFRSFTEFFPIDLNDHRVAVGQLDEFAWSSSGPVGPVIPDPRLGLPPGDLVTPLVGRFTAIDDLGQIHGFGAVVDSFGNEISGLEYDLLQVPEPS